MSRTTGLRNQDHARLDSFTRARFLQVNRSVLVEHCEELVRDRLDTKGTDLVTYSTSPEPVDGTLGA